MEETKKTKKLKVKQKYVQQAGDWEKPIRKKNASC